MRQTIRHAGGVALLRVIEVTGGLLLIAFIPRLMGPAIYGQFSLIYTLSMWFSLLNGMGSVSIMTHFVPSLMEQSDQAGLRKLAGGILALRTLGGIASAIAYFVLAALWLPDVGIGSIILMAVSLGARSVANLPFAVFLGMNRAAQWSVAETLRRGLIAPATFLGFQWDGLRGACYGLVGTEILVLAVGLYWGRSFLSWANFRIDRKHLRPYLRYSIGFLAGNVVIMMYSRIGGPLIHLLSGEFAEVAFYAVAYGAFLTGASALAALLNALGPMLSSLRLRGEKERLRLYIERLLTVCGILSVVASATVYCFSDGFVRAVLGPGYAPVVPLLQLLSVAGILLGPGELARVLAVVDNRPRIPLLGAALQLTVFASATLALFPVIAGRGIAIAVIAATATFSVYSTWGLSRYVRYSMSHWLKIASIGVVSSPLLWAWNEHPALRWVAFNAVLLTSVFLLRILKVGDVTGSWDAVRAAIRGDAEFSLLQ